MLLYIAANVFIFRAIDGRSHSSSDTLITFAPRFLLLTALLYFICYWKEERPRWQWRNTTWRRGLQVGGILRRGGIVVMSTDTTYGIVGSALRERTVNEIYRLRKRDLNKPFIVLIADKSDLKKFGVAPTKAQEKILDKVWPVCVRTRTGRPGPTSVILPCPNERFAYLHRGKNSLAFRVPAKRELRMLLRRIGPLVAPSANPQGLPVAKNISEARAYFGHHVGFYQDSGIITASPSKLFDITDGTEKILRA